ncbi:Beta-galactosidase 3 [Lacticaseibacillus rhamnosus LRHMDP2]|uniref:Beta-galactosidase 3 n=1 Tax=Lacticaseibacillus rhamnosus LRHMDP3 TaxID=1203259 RepID=A0AB33XV18_LACRH|nr:Beta-galactosidase 3 [Lacticaseibacillus rhamnosus LRHMDP3]EKS51599.1 Beta-galactosidase 3 [Lacticaseibacillus rhamnosus LRHMDP2]
MAKSGPSRLRLLMFWLTLITRSQAQKSACKDLRRNGQSPAITSEATYTPVSKRPCSRSVDCSIFNLPLKMLRC